jgi:hypothetical protein
VEKNQAAEFAGPKWAGATNAEYACMVFRIRLLGALRGMNSNAIRAVGIETNRPEVAPEQCEAIPEV